MGLSFDADGTVLADGTEQNLFSSQTDDFTYWCQVSCDEMTSGDVLVIKTYIHDKNDTTERIIYSDRITYSMIKNDPMYYIPPIPTDSFRVTIQQIEGTNRNYTWRRGSY